MNTTCYILDASVAAKWFLPHTGEPLHEEALKILEAYAFGRIGLSVPDLFWPELGNVLWKAVRLGRMTRESARQALESLLSKPIPTSPSLPLIADAFAIAATFRCTIYDGTYVALAVSTGAPLLTADQQLATALQGGVPVRWLGSVVPE